MGTVNTPATPRQMLTWLGLAAFIIAVDQVTKNWILAHYQLGDSTRVLDFFNIVRVHNTGAAFSFLADSGGWQRWFFTGIGLFATVFIVWLLRSNGGQRLFAFALANILGGAVGNVIDRLQHGYVVDFLDFYVGRWHFPAFNAADSAITLGAICLILDELRRWRQSRR